MAEHNVGYDKQDPRPMFVGVVTISILVFTFISGFVVKAYFFREVHEFYTEQVLQSPNEQLIKLRADSDVRLHRYGWVNQSAGVVHMPIEEAMPLVVADLAKPKVVEPAKKPEPKKK